MTDIAEGLASKEFERLGQNILRLLANVGELGHCKGCGAVVYWVTHRSGKKAPYTQDATIHFANCPQAARFRKRRDGDDGE